jgi:hypothetical protein
MDRTAIWKGDSDVIMEFTDGVLTPLGVLLLALDHDFELATKCFNALAEYVAEFPIGNNQLPAIVFLDTYDGVFGAVDIWEEKDTEEVM